MLQQNQKQREVILIFGKTGSGKSTLAESLIKDFERVIIIDSKHEYTDGIIFYKLSLMLKYYMNYLNKLNKDCPFSFICRFDNDEEIELLFKACEKIENLLLVCEEIEIYVSPYQKKSNFLDLVRYGRHHAISILGIARRCAELSTDFKAMVDTIYSFKQTFPSDLKIMEGLGFEGLNELPEYEYKRVDY